MTMPCPTPGKIGYLNRGQAEAAMVVAYDRPRLRAYQCRCGHWHLTRHHPWVSGEQSEVRP